MGPHQQLIKNLNKGIGSIVMQFLVVQKLEGTDIHLGDWIDISKHA